MNDGKKGAAYDYPDSFVQLLGYMKAYFHLPFRQAEGVDLGLMLMTRYHLYQTTVR